MRIAVTGLGAISAAGRGPAAVVEALRTGVAPSTAAPYPTEGLGNPRAAVVAPLDRARPAEALLALAVGDALAQASRDRADLVVGTSSGNMSGPWERWHRAATRGEPADRAGTGRDDTARAVADRLDLGGRVTTLSVACASGTAALAVAAGWLADGAETVVAAGVDALSLFVHAGFGGLGALCADLPRPFSADRDGLLLGEGAAALVLEPLDRARARGAVVLAELAGVGLSCDARHLTAPHREGRGVTEAIRAALAQAGHVADDVDLVSVHGTGTVYNDAMEAQALATVFGSRPLHVYGVKRAIGHTLGAAGALECAVAVHALATGIQPTAIRDVDPALPWPAAAPEGRPTLALVTSSAFGGINAAALFGPGRDRPSIGVDTRADVSVVLPPGVDLASVWPDAPPRAARIDRYNRVGLWAVGRALALAGPIDGEIGLVLATRAGCCEADLAHHARIVAEGAARASRLWFAATVPSAPAAEAAVTYGLRGPLLAFVGADDPAEEAERLIRHGGAGALVALWCDAPSPDAPATARARVLVARG